MILFYPLPYKTLGHFFVKLLQVDNLMTCLNLRGGGANGRCGIIKLNISLLGQAKRDTH